MVRLQRPPSLKRESSVLRGQRRDVREYAQAAEDLPLPRVVWRRDLAATDHPPLRPRRLDARAVIVVVSLPLCPAPATPVAARWHLAGRISGGGEG